MSSSFRAEYSKRQQLRLDGAIEAMRLTHDACMLEKAKTRKLGIAGVGCMVGSIIMARLGVSLNVQIPTFVTGCLLDVRSAVHYFTYYEPMKDRFQNDVEFADRIAQSVRELRDVHVGRKVLKLGRTPSLVASKPNDNILQ